MISFYGIICPFSTAFGFFASQKNDIILSFSHILLSALHKTVPVA
jgi:hypothetical protein